MVSTGSATDRRRLRALDVLRSEARGCIACDLHCTRTLVVFDSGNPTAEFMVIGEAPGRDEDLAGIPFVGRSGRLITSLIEDAFGHDREWCYIANVVKCRPPDNRNPTRHEIATCRHFLESQISLVQPRLVMSLGNIATRTLLESTEGITALRGRLISRGDYMVMPTFHPAAALRGGAKVMELLRDDIREAAIYLGATNTR